MLVSATVELGVGVEQGNEEGTMMWRLGPCLFALRGSCDMLCTCLVVGEEDVYCEECYDKWCC